MKKCSAVFIALLLAGCASSSETTVATPPEVSSSQHTTAEDEEVAEPTSPVTIISKHQQGPLPPNVRSTTDAEIVALLEKKATFALLYNSDICGAGAHVWGELDAYDAPWPLLILNSNFEGAPDKAFSPQIENILNNTKKATPTLFLIRDGVLIDETRTLTSQGALERFVERNTTSGGPHAIDTSPGGWPPAKRRKALLYGSALFYSDWSGVNLEGLTLKRKSFEGADLRNASFKGSTLEAINFSHANLQGVDFQGASLNKVFWGACVCPDGTQSAEHGYSCEDHLIPDRHPEIATDPGPDPSTEALVRNNRMISDIEDARHSSD